MKKDMITMSIKELKKLHLVKKADEKLITQAQAAELLSMTERQFRRIIRKYREHGDQGIVHALRGQSSHRKCTHDFKQSIVDIYQKDFSVHKPTFFTEKLIDEHNITISKETVRLILAEHGLWTIREKKVKHRKKRPRKSHRGELVQLDGMPQAIYADLHSTYRNNNKKLSIEEQLAGNTAHTQFSRALDQLEINYIPAFSPQAKGRVERNFQPFQDRLVKLKST